MGEPQERQQLAEKVRDGIADFVADNWPDRKHSLSEIEAGIRAVEIKAHLIRCAPPAPGAAPPAEQLQAVATQGDGPAAAPRELTERQLVACLVESGCIGTIKMSFDSGPYITRPTLDATRLCRAIGVALGATPQAHKRDSGEES